KINFKLIDRSEVCLVILKRIVISICVSQCEPHTRSGRRYSVGIIRPSIPCSIAKKDHNAPNGINLSDGKIIYSVAAAIGHNEEAHPESHFTFPAIYHGSEIFELQNFAPASVDDIAKVHARPYAMEQALEKGIIYIDGSGSTYVTATTFEESLVAAGAGISLIDSVVAASKTRQDPPMGFALIRPPGHHAIPKGPMGCCVLGNMAIAARYAQHLYSMMTRTYSS
ncbi:Histone deacetylase domain, partial [Dillenia turbinata]